MKKCFIQEIIFDPNTPAGEAIDMDGTYTFERTDGDTHRLYVGCRPFMRDGFIVFDLTKSSGLFIT